MMNHANEFAGPQHNWYSGTSLPEFAEALTTVGHSLGQQRSNCRRREEPRVLNLGVAMTVGSNRFIVGMNLEGTARN
jgi:hypothetical protein